jgi:hypothetical protein
MTITTRDRTVGGLGTAARLLVGGFLVGAVLHGSFTGDGAFEPETWLLALIGLPAAITATQAWWARRHPGPLVALTGPIGHAFTFGVFMVLYGTTWYAPTIGFVSDAALVFFGSSMLLAAARGYGGCEVLATSNWLLRRDDRVGCLIFDPVDRVEGRLEHVG